MPLKIVDFRGFLFAIHTTVDLRSWPVGLLFGLPYASSCRGACLENLALFGGGGGVHLMNGFELDLAEIRHTDIVRRRGEIIGKVDRGLPGLKSETWGTRQ